MTDLRRQHIFEVGDLLLTVRDYLRRWQDEPEAASLAEQCEVAAEGCYLHALPDGAVRFSETAREVARTGIDTCLRVAIAGSLDVDDATLVAMASAQREHSVMLARIAGDTSGEPFPFDASPAAALDVAERAEYVLDGLRRTVDALAAVRS